MSEKLKSCPFCGSEDIGSGKILGVTSPNGKMLFRQTVCMSCQAAGPAVYGRKPTDAEADAKWNERAEKPS